MNYGCEGKVAFISGGTSGIGKAVAELLLKDGAEVWLLGRDAEKGTEAAVTLSAYGKVHYVQGDVKDLEACRSAAQNVREQRENIDLIVNAAGIYQERRLEKVTEYDFFPAAGGKYQLRAFRHPHDLKSMAAFKCVHTQNSQRVAGNNYQLHPAAVKIINDLTYKPAYFGFTAGPVRRTRRIAHINKILLRQRRLQTF